MPELLNFSIESKNLSAYFKDDYLVISYLALLNQKSIHYSQTHTYNPNYTYNPDNPYNQGYILTFSQSEIVNTLLLPPEPFKHRVINSTAYTITSTNTDLVAYAYINKKWSLQWGEIVSDNWVIYDKTIIFSQVNKDNCAIFSMYTDLGKKQNVSPIHFRFPIPFSGQLKAQICHKGLVYLLFEKRLFIYNLKNDQLEGKLGFPFVYRDDFEINESTFLSDGVITFHEKNANQTITSGLVKYFPLKFEVNNSSQKLLILKIATVVLTIFAALSLVALFTSLGFNLINLKISMGVITILSSAIGAGLFFYKNKMMA